MTYYKELGRKLGQHHKEIEEKVENESVKRKTLTAIENDYTDFAIPLCSLDNTDANSNFYFSGNIFLKRYNMASQMASIEITCGKMYNATLPYCFMASNDIKADILVRPITFTYNDTQYFGLYFSGVETYFSEGYARGEASDWNIIDCIAVYNSNTQTILNEEIYNSIAYTSEEQQLPKEFYTTPQVHLNGAGEVYKLLSEADVDTVPTSGSNNPVSSDGVYKAIQSIDTGNITIDSELSSTSTNSVQNKVITAKLSEKQDANFDSNGYVHIDEITKQLNDTDQLVQNWYDSSVIGTGVMPSIINMGELSQFHDKIDNVLFNGGTYGVCNTAFNTAAKTVTISEWNAKAGSVIYVKFANGISNNHNITLSINNSSAYTVYINGTDGTTSLNTSITNGAIIQLIFDGDKFIAYNLCPDNAYYANNAWSVYVEDFTEYPQHGGRYLAFAQDYGYDGVIIGASPSIELNEDNQLTCDITGNAETATTALKLNNTSAIGGATTPVYFNASGVPVALDYTLAKSVPSDAKFTDTTYSTATSSTAGLVKIGYTTSGKNYAVQLSNGQMYVNVPWTDNNTTYGVVSTTADGLAPKRDGSTTKYLRADGTWAVPPDNNTTYSNFVKSGSGAKAGLVPAPSTTAGTTKYLREDGTWTVPPNTDTKNTAGSTDSSSKLFLVGATSQAANPQTYSHNTAYIGTDGHLYSDSKQVVNLSGTQALTNKTYNGYTLGAACAKGVSTIPTSGSAALVTSGGVYTALQSRMLVGTDVYDAGNGVKNTNINSTNYPGIKSFRFAPMEYSGLTINCSTSCEFIGTGDIDNHYYNYTGTSYDTKTKFTNSTIKSSASVTFRGILFQNTYGDSIISETSYTTDVRYQFIDCDFCISEASDYYPLFVLKNSSIEFINCRFYLNTNTTGPCYHIVDSSYNNAGTTTIKLTNSIVNYSSTSNEDTVFATTNGGATKVIIENSFINNGNPIKPTANFNDGFGITISNSELRDCNIIGSQTSYTGLTKGHFVINNCRFTGTQTPYVYTSGNLVNISNNTFESSSNILLHGEYNIFANNMSDATISLYEYANTKGTITGNTASAITQPSSATTYTKTGNYPAIS